MDLTNVEYSLVLIMLRLAEILCSHLLDGIKL